MYLITHFKTSENALLQHKLTHIQA